MVCFRISDFWEPKLPVIFRVSHLHPISKPPGDGGKANSLLLTKASCKSSLIYGNYKSIESSHFNPSVHFGLQRWEVGNYFKDPPDFELMASQVAKWLILNVVRVNSAPQLGHVNFFAAPDFSRTWRSQLLNGESCHGKCGSAPCQGSQTPTNRSL
jgi:hypothetical protein